MAESGEENGPIKVEKDVIQKNDGREKGKREKSVEDAERAPSPDMLI